MFGLGPIELLILTAVLVGPIVFGVTVLVKEKLSSASRLGELEHVQRRLDDLIDSTHALRGEQKAIVDRLNQIEEGQKRVGP